MRHAALVLVAVIAGVTPAAATGDTAPVATPHTTNAVIPGTYTCTVVIDP